MRGTYPSVTSTVKLRAFDLNKDLRIKRRRFARASWYVVAAGCLVSVASQLAPRRLAAQTVDYFQAFAVPPRSAGTCMPPDIRHTGTLSPLTTVKLVMVSSPPGSRREMTVSADRTGRVVGYSEFIVASTSIRSSRGDNVLATIDGRGQVHGWRIQSTTRLPDSIPLGFDPGNRHGMRDHMITTSSRDTLTSRAQRQVLDLAEWLRRRCPA